MRLRICFLLSCERQVYDDAIMKSTSSLKMDGWMGKLACLLEAPTFSRGPFLAAARNRENGASKIADKEIVLSSLSLGRSQLNQRITFRKNKTMSKLR